MYELSISALAGGGMRFRRGLVTAGVPDKLMNANLQLESEHSYKTLIPSDPKLA